MHDQTTPANCVVLLYQNSVTLTPVMLFLTPTANASSLDQSSCPGKSKRQRQNLHISSLSSVPAVASRHRWIFRPEGLRIKVLPTNVFEDLPDERRVA